MSNAPLPKEHMRDLDSLAEERRRALEESVALLRRRVAPAHLKARVQNRLLDGTLDILARAKGTIRENPVRTLGIAALLGAILARRRIVKIAARGALSAADYFKNLYRKHGTSASEEGRNE